MTRHGPLTILVAATLAVAACSADPAAEPIGTPSPTTTESTTVTNASTAAPSTTAVPLDTIEPVDTEDTDPAPMPDPDFQDWLRTRWEYTVGDGPGLIEADKGFAPVLLEPGTYTTDSMVTPMTFTLETDNRLVVERPTFMVLVDHDAPELWTTPLVHFIRPRGLTDPERTADGPPIWPPTVPGWDFDAWFDAHPGIAVERSELEVGGRPAIFYDVTFPSYDGAGWECRNRAHCVPFVIDWGGPHDLVTADPTRVWVVDQGDFAPILIHAAIGEGEEWGDYGEQLDALVGSIELGDPAPTGLAEAPWEHAISGVVPAGPVELPILDGVRFELPYEAFVNQARDWSLIDIPGEWSFYPPNVEIAGAAQTFGFEPIESAEQLAQLLVDKVGATRAADAELLGRPAVVLEMLGVQPGNPIFRHVDLPDDAHPDVGVWYTQDYVELWAVDTEQGVLIVTAEAADPDELDVARELHAQVRASLELL